jgi:hypothetical protein
MNEKAVIAQLDVLLTPLGFMRKKSVWNRNVGDMVDVIDVQVSKAGDTITVNAGVLERDVHTKLWGERPPLFVEEPWCTVRARAGALIDGHDRWWQLNKANTAIDVSQAVGSHVLPFVNQMHTRQAMVEWLVAAEVVGKKYPPPILSLAILNHGLGKNAEACSLLIELRSRSVGDWRTRSEEVARRLGCMVGDKAATP